MSGINAHAVFCQCSRNGGVINKPPASIGTRMQASRIIDKRYRCWPIPINHPLLDFGRGCISSGHGPFAPSLTAFQCILSSQRHTYMWDHKVLGQNLVPATCFLELANAAVVCSLGRHFHLNLRTIEPRLKEFTLMMAKVLEKGPEQGTNLAVSCEINGNGTVQITSRSDPDCGPGPGAAQVHRHVEATVIGGAQPCLEPRRLVDEQKKYPFLQYVMRASENIFLTDGSPSTLAVTAGLQGPGHSEGYLVHPSGYDAALHLGAIAWGDFNLYNAPFVPVSVKATQHGRMSTTDWKGCWAVARHHASKPPTHSKEPMHQNVKVTSSWMIRDDDASRQRSSSRKATSAGCIEMYSKPLGRLPLHRSTVGQLAVVGDSEIKALDEYIYSLQVQVLENETHTAKAANLNVNGDRNPKTRPVITVDVEGSRLELLCKGRSARRNTNKEAPVVEASNALATMQQLHKMGVPLTAEYGHAAKGSFIARPPMRTAILDSILDTLIRVVASETDGSGPSKWGSLRQDPLQNGRGHEEFLPYVLHNDDTAAHTGGVITGTRLLRHGNWR